MKHCGLIFLFIAAITAAEQARSGWSYTHTTGVSWNPLGLLVEGKLTRTFALYPSKQGVLWESGRIECSLKDEWSPSDNLAALVLQIEPIAFFDLELKAGYFSQFDELGYGCFRANTATHDYDEATKERIGRNDAYGYWISATPTLKFQVSHVILVNSAAINRIGIDGKGYFHEVRSNLMRRVTDLDLTNNTFLFYETPRNVLAGVRYQGIRVFGSKAQSQLLCAAAIVRPRSACLANSFLFLCVGAYTDDPLLHGKIYIGIQAGKTFSLGAP